MRFFLVLWSFMLCPVKPSVYKIWGTKHARTEFVTVCQERVLTHPVAKYYRPTVIHLIINWCLFHFCFLSHYSGHRIDLSPLFRHCEEFLKFLQLQNCLKFCLSVRTSWSLSLACKIDVFHWFRSLTDEITTRTSSMTKHSLFTSKKISAQFPLKIF